MPASSAVPIYLESPFDAVSGLYHPAADGAGADSAVLICAPWGWEETASYRGRRFWAERLAAAGHPVLRFELPSVGDSAGAVADERRVEAWVAAIAAAAGWLRAEAGRPRLAVLGLGLGGLLALAALDEGVAIDEVVLWAVHGKGAKFVRETRAFSRLQGRTTGAGSPLPESWLEAGGFVLSEETLTALKGLEPANPPSPCLRRALLLERDGADVDADLRQRLEAAEVDVTVAPGEGWGRFAGLTEFPVEVLEEVTPVLDLVADWLAQPGQPSSAPPETAPPQSTELSFEQDGHGATESVLTLEQDGGRIYGVLSTPVEEPASDLCVVFLNAGGIRHIGPSRVWVEAARRWAPRGLPSLRIDLEGIGEADGAPIAIAGLAADQYSAKYCEKVVAVLDALEQRGLGKRFLLVGLCSGGYWSFQTALRDERVYAAVLLNAGALIWHSELKIERHTRNAAKAIRSRRSWGKLLRGEVDLRVWWRILRQAGLRMLRQAGRSLRQRLGASGEGSADPQHDIGDLFDRLMTSGTPVAMGFCPNEVVLAELEAGGYAERLGDWPNLSLDLLEGEDHGLGPVATQRSANALIDRELERSLERRRGELDAAGLQRAGVQR